MRKKRIKKNFWFDDEEENLLKNLSQVSGKKEVEVIRKLVRGATIKEKPPQEFYEITREIIQLRKELKSVKDDIRHSRFSKQLDTDKIKKLIDNIDELRAKNNTKVLNGLMEDFMDAEELEAAI